MIELSPSQTAILLHWPYHPIQDQSFILPGIHATSTLDPTIDALLEEHVPSSNGSQEVLTEITIFRCYPNGAWDSEDIVSHYYADAA